MSLTTLKELAAAAGVVGSMLFVGVQIHQNTEAVRGATVQGIADQSMQFNLELSLDREWLRVFRKVNHDSVPFADLEPIDQAQLGWVASTSLRIMENRFRQHQLGILPEEPMAQLGASRTWYGSTWFREWWDEADRKGGYSPDFIEYMENNVLRPSPR